MTQQTNLFNEIVPVTPHEILEHCPTRPHAQNAALLAFSGGNDSRCLAHVVKRWFDDSPYDLELAAIDTELSENGWRESVIEYAKLLDLPVSFWGGEGRKYYTEFVNEYGFPGQAKHSQIQNRLKGRAFRKMKYARQGENNGQVWILSGIRKFESQKRRKLKSPYSEREGLQFINPLFYWENYQVLDYLDDHNLPLSPFTQGDCKCGATTKNADHEWAAIKANSPELYNYLSSFDCPWAWGKYTGDYQPGGWFDDGSIESFPVCATCTRDNAAEDERLLSEWG